MAILEKIYRGELMAINIPVEHYTNAMKIAYMQKLEEKLRIVYNVMGKWKRIGITYEEYNTLPNILKADYPYQNQLDSDSWDDFTKWFKETQLDISKEKQAKKKDLIDDNALVVNIDTALEKKPKKKK